jgi:hypothetical protein
MEQESWKGDGKIVLTCLQEAIVRLRNGNEEALRAAMK